MSRPPKLEPVLGLARDETHTYSAWYPPAPPVILPSVTTVLGVLNKPALLGWYGKIAATWAVENVEILTKLVADLGHDAAIKAVAQRGAGERDRRAAIGTKAHQAVESLLAGLIPLPDPDTAPLLEQYQRFAAEWAFVPEWSEAMVASDRYGYAGTFDLYGRLEGRRVLLDIKTGSFVAPEHGLQLAAYAGADYIGKPGTADRWKVPPVDLYAVLQLQPDGYRVIPYYVTAADQKAFLAALDLYRWTREGSRKIVGQDLTKGALHVAS